MALLSIALGCQTGYANSPKEIVGGVQKATVFPGNLTLRARIDSGAKTASINARNIQHIQRSGAPWVRFEVTNSAGKTVAFERPIIGTTKIKRHSESAQQRTLITLRLCLGGITKRTPVTLADRSGYDYQLLIGRDFLAHDFLIDPGATFLRLPSCAADKR